MEEQAAFVPYDPLKTLTDLYGEDLAHAQLALEAEAYEIGAERFNQAMAYKAEAGQAGDTKIARPLIADMVPKLSMKLIEFIASQQTGRPGKKAAAFKHIRGIDPNRIAFLALREFFNFAVREGIQPVQISEAIGRCVEDEARFGRLREQDLKNYKDRIAPAIRKRGSDHFKRAYARAVEVSMETAGEVDKWEPWGTSARVAVGLKCLELMIELGLVTLTDIKAGTSAHRKIITVSDEVAGWMAERSSFLAGMSPNWTPCVVPPKPWTGMHRGGYWGRGRSNPKLVKGLPRAQQKRYRDVDLDRVLRAVNVIQETPWAINKKVLAVAREVVGWNNSPVQGMASPEVTPKPVRPDGIDQDPALLKAWKKQASGTWRRERARRSRRIALESTIEQATKFAGFERIWFPYNVDFRGRVYAIPTFCPQGTDLAKGLLLLADAIPMGPEGEYWLRMHIANTAGLDKKTMPERIQWTHDNEALILATAENPLENLWWATDSDSPFCFLAACFEYAAWKLEGNTYKCGIAIAFDGSCSGIQHFSAMLRDEVGGKAVNLVPADKPSDIYRIVADKVQEVVTHDLENGTEDSAYAQTNEETGEITQGTEWGTKSIARWWNTYGITRTVTKRCVMTLPYGSKKFGFADHILEDTVQPAVDSMGQDVFPDERKAAGYMAGLVWDALETTVVAAVKAMAWLQKAAGALASQQMPVHWVTPVGFPVWQEYRLRDMHRVDTVICGSLRLTMTVGGEFDEKHELDNAKQISGIAPNFVHSMDASHLMLTALAAKDQGVDHFAMIHDSFGTCPGLAGTMFRVVRETMVQTYTERDVIKDFYEGFCMDLTEKAAEKIPELPEKGSLELEGILKSTYCFC